jgi:hypothetical protein
MSERWLRFGFGYCLLARDGKRRRQKNATALHQHLPKYDHQQSFSQPLGLPKPWQKERETILTIFDNL